jgi:hypothetical protein
MKTPTAVARAGRLCVVLVGLVAPALGFTQGRPGGPSAPPPPKTAREAAPVDLTGTWVSVVSEDWRWRMLTPLKGDFQSIPLNAEGVRVGLLWDPAADEAAGEQCKSYGAPAIMRIPGRVRISWQDDNALKIETDAGGQTRLLRFDAPPTTSELPSRQGYSVANWERPVHGRATGAALSIFTGNIGTHGRSLEVTTTNLRAGYLRRNGPPYSAAATVQEYFDQHVEPNGDEWFTVTTVVTDPTYLSGPFVTSTDFKKERSSAGWDPQPCSAR